MPMAQELADTEADKHRQWQRAKNVENVAKRKQGERAKPDVSGHSQGYGRAMDKSASGQVASFGGMNARINSRVRRSVLHRLLRHLGRQSVQQARLFSASWHVRYGRGLQDCRDSQGPAPRQKMGD